MSRHRGPAAVDDELRAFRDAAVDQPDDAVARGAGDHRPHLDVRRVARADRHARGRASASLLDERVAGVADRDDAEIAMQRSPAEP